MARALVRFLASLCLIAGAVALFIDLNGGTVRLRELEISSPASQEHNTYFVTLPHSLTTGIALLLVAILLFGLSRTRRRKKTDDQGEE